MDMVRVRIAPSPTGFFHVGTARTALYNWLFARRNNGKFILRIEDTDVKRSTKAMVDVITESLKWLGLDWDEGPIFQSERTSIYQKYVEELLKKGLVYPCYCTSEELISRKEAAEREKKSARGYDRRCFSLTEEEKLRFEKEGRPKALRFFVKEGRTLFHDEIHGRIEKDNSEIEDFVVLKSDGSPTYNLAVVVDDAEMEITHVIRGNDHISNTPKQVMLYEAFGMNPPKFAHLPLILGEDKAKFSKRHGCIAVTDYKKQGYMPDTLVNFLALLGWSPGDDREIMTREELISAFSLGRVMKGGAVFDIRKLQWMNGEYIDRLNSETLFKEASPFLLEEQLFDRDSLEENKPFIMDVLDLMKSRMKVLADFAVLGDYFFTENYSIDSEGVSKCIDKPAIQRLLSLKERFAELDAFTKESTELVVRELAAELDVKAALLIHPTRVALTGKRVGPGLFEILEVLGKDKVVNRIDKFVAPSSSQA